jgi:hypothetical protein
MATRPPDGLGLAALAAQIADLREDVTTVKARVEAAGMAGGTKLHERVAAIERTLQELADDGTKAHPSAPVWFGLDDDAYAKQLANLTQWVERFLIVHYPHVPWQPCWAQHPAALWELGNLWAEHRRIYDRKQPALADALVWHDRWLPGAAVRLERILRDCRARHSPTSQARARPRARVV